MIALSRTILGRKIWLLHAVATLVEREWLPLGRIGHRYALELIDGQVASLRMYCASLETGILEFARASGCVLEAFGPFRLHRRRLHATTPNPRRRRRRSHRRRRHQHAARRDARRIDGGRGYYK